MTWLNNTTATAKLSIAGVDYNDNIIAVQITDQSVVNNGAMFTTGTINLGEAPGESKLEDYAKTKFPRNALVLIDLEIDGETKRHPRGYLYVLDSTWNPEDRTQQIAVGCLLTLYNATDNIEELRTLTAYELPEDAGFSEFASSIAAEGKFLWQDNQGDLHKIDFYGGDGLGSEKEPAEWVSVRDHTALSSAPLGGGTPVPDTIKMTYSWEEDAPEEGDGSDDEPDGKPAETDQTTSTYWLEHPARLQRKQTVCNQTPTGTVCKEINVNDAKTTFSVTKTVQSKRNYNGPGNSLGTEIQITKGVACEVQGSYFAERYSWELARNGYKDDGIQLRGLNVITQEKREKTYEYGSGGEVVRTVQKTYKNYIAAMTQNDWRSGIGQTEASYDPSGPQPGAGQRGFLTEIPDDKMYLDQKVIVKYEYFDNKTKETTTTIKSSAVCNDVGIYPATGSRVLQDIGADTNGTRETSTRTSSGGLVNPDQPGRPGEDGKVTRSAVFTQESTKYLPTAAGSVTYSGTIPFTSKLWTEETAREITANYTKHIKAFIEGDSAGIRVAECMRPEIFDYYPGMPFTYYDRQYNKVVKLRMNATGWAISATEALVSTDGIFIGLSNGTVDIGSNVPAIEGGTTRKGTRQGVFAEYKPPAVSDEVTIDNGHTYAVEEYIAFDLYLALGSYTGHGDDGLGIVDDWDNPPQILFNPNDQIYVSGLTVSKEAELMEVDAIGSIPESADGSILETEQGVLIPDLFDPSLGVRPEQTYFVTIGPPTVDESFRVTVFVEPPDQTFDVEVFAEPADQIFDVVTIDVLQVDVAEVPFIVMALAEPPDQIFDVRTSAVPPDTNFVVTTGPELPSSTPEGAIFDVFVGTAYQVKLGVAVPDEILLVTVADAPARDPDEQFNVSVGGPDAPPIPEADEILEVSISYAIPDRTFPTTVVTEYFVDVAGHFPVIVGPEPPAKIFEVRSSAPPADVRLNVEVMAEPLPGENILPVIVAEDFITHVSYRPVNYFVTYFNGDYVVTGPGFTNAINPTLIAYVGQTFSLNMNAPDYPVWIKEEPSNDEGEPVPPFVKEWGLISGQNVAQGLVLLQFSREGTFYYCAVPEGGPIGTIEVRSPFADDAEFTFDVQVFLEPADQVMQVAALDHIFDVQLPGSLRVDVLDEVFNVTLVTGLENVTVQSNLRVDVLDGVLKVAAVDQLMDVFVGESPLMVAALDESFEVIRVADIHQVEVLDEVLNVEVRED